MHAATHLRTRPVTLGAVVGATATREATQIALARTAGLEINTCVRLYFLSGWVDGWVMGRESILVATRPTKCTAALPHSQRGIELKLTCPADLRTSWPDLGMARGYRNYLGNNSGSNTEASVARCP